MRAAGRRAAGLLQGLGELLMTLGVVVLLFAAYELWFTNFYTARQQTQLSEQLRKSWAAPRPVSTASSPVGPPMGSGIAVMWIPRLGVVGRHADVVVEGVGVEDLKKGPGHYPGTALPGQLGNVVISGHRTTYLAPFNRVDELHRGDPIVLETRDRWYTYQVLREQVVAPTAIDVTYPVPGHFGEKPTRHLLTLTTCNPKYSASQRLIVYAELTSAVAKGPGVVPPGLAGVPAAAMGG